MKAIEIMEALTDMDDNVLGLEADGNVKKKSRGVRWLPRVAAIAAVIALMTLTAFAAEDIVKEKKQPKPFEGFFSEPLSEKQQTIINSIGTTGGNPIVEQEVIITPIAAMSDESFCWLHLQVEAPEGVVLPDMNDDENYYYCFAGKYQSRFQLQHRYSSNGKWENLWCSHTVKPLKDENPNDNLKEFVLVIHGSKGENTFRRTGQTRLIIPGLYIHKGKDTYLNTLFTANFICDISTNNLEQIDDFKAEVITDGVTFYNEEYDYTTTVNKVTISPLHLDVDFTTTAPNNKYIFPYGGPIELVMKDGTRIHALDAWFDARNQTVADPDDVAGPKVTYFTAPIVVQDIDYIILGGEHIFNVN